MPAVNNQPLKKAAQILCHGGAHAILLVTALCPGAFAGQTIDRNDLTPQASDPMWLKYAKSSIVCDKRLDFATSQKYEQGALTELEKIANAKGHIDQKDEKWINDMLRHDKQFMHDFACQRNKFKAELAENKKVVVFPANLTAENIDEERKKLKATEAMLTKKLDETEGEITRESKAKVMRGQRICTVLSKLLPAQSDVLQFWKNVLETDKRNYASYLSR
ncbi:MAG: hypothetical protein C0508_09510 [Cyanobacteria bacterium PR.023]|nr:hypothetical protein [Cyanobacteria bacterium PR.023]